jgi:hypothetical protein
MEQINSNIKQTWRGALNRKVDITFCSLHLCSIRENSDSVGIGFREKKERNTTTRTKRPQIINKINKVNVPEGSINIKLDPMW